MKVKANKEVLNKLNKILKKSKDKDVDKSVNQTATWIMGGIMRDKLTGQVLNVRSNQLRGGFSVRKVAHNKYDLTNRMVYAAIQELGGVIRPKVADYLCFKTSTGYVRTKKVTIPERSYVRSFANERWNAILDKCAGYLWEKV